MQIYLYTFNKKVNSTKRPTGGAAFDVTLKDGCNIINPTLVFAGIPNPTAYNYAYIPDFNRYYYVTNWEAYRDRWTVSLAVDTLASYRDQIGSSHQFIGRSEAAYNGRLVDGEYPALSGVTITPFVLNNPAYTYTPANGCYVVSIASYQTAASGLQHYATYYEGLRVIMDRVNAQGMIFRDLADFIVAIRWYPFPLSAMPVSAANLVNTATGGGDKIAIGSVFIDIDESDPSIYRMVSLAKSFVNSLQVSDLAHPQASRGEYLNSAPYTRLLLAAPPFGSIAIDASMIAGRYLLGIDIIVDFATGSGRLCIIASDFREGQIIGNTIATYNAQIGVGVPLIAESVNLLALTNSIVQAVPAVASGNPLGIVTAGTGIISNMIPDATIINGGGGSFSNYDRQPRLLVIHQDIADEHPEAGRPLLETRMISTIPGYIQIPDPHFDIAGTSGELVEIISTARTGFFYE